ncbi:MAG: hypothetical protein QM473_15255 [Acidobacteriota bacterium]|nr:hypothetical protein [Acidobacteriota bacterium]
MSTPPTATAYHEAGHALLAWFCEYPTAEVSTIPDAAAGLAGYRLAHDADQEDPLQEDPARALLCAANSCMVCLAGGVAGRIACGAGEPSDSDVAGAWHCALQASETEDAAEAFMRWCELQAEAIIMQYRAGLEALAGALADHRRIPGEEAYRIIGEAVKRTSKQARED